MLCNDPTITATTTTTQRLHHFLLVLEGVASMELCVQGIMQEEEEDEVEEEVEVLGVVQEMEVKAGGFVFVPSHMVVRARCGSGKIAAVLKIATSGPPSYADLLKLVVTHGAASLERTLAGRKGMPLAYTGHVGLIYSDGETDPSEQKKTDSFLQQARSLATQAILDKTIMQQALRSLSRITQYVPTHFDAYEWVLEKYGDLEKRLDESGGLVKIPQFLPEDLAYRILETLQGLSDAEWLATEGRTDQGYNINHTFSSAKHFRNSRAIFRLFKLLIPHLPSSLSAAKYVKTHHIDAHDDKAYKTIDGLIHSRHIALIYYLTPEWTSADGGLLLDLHNPHKPHATDCKAVPTAQAVSYVPQFNSLIAFKVPRHHMVTPVTSAAKARCSIFGWFHVPGMSYPLFSTATATTTTKKHN
eukprot:TRINITY_DN6280_c0_g1_i1.p1 TRINITY_DN6280_c0_g1~~TRINITY_DN6280_c0_g1_i1.p1  ORF type:complete len:415 (+),score=58.36 TRINITY_DN6280_c0_g1_i1:304-1548(+)